MCEDRAKYEVVNISSRTFVMISSVLAAMLVGLCVHCVVLLQPYLGLAAPQKVKIYVVLSPVGPYYKVRVILSLAYIYLQ